MMMFNERRNHTTVEEIKALYEEKEFFGFGSTCIDSIYVEPCAYCEVTEICINFVSGSSYGYVVPLAVVVELINAESIGKAYHKLVRGKYESWKVG